MQPMRLKKYTSIIFDTPINTNNVKYFYTKSLLNSHCIFLHTHMRKNQCQTIQNSLYTKE